MSKAEGKIISIKFTQPINEIPLQKPKYKYFRWEIVNSWSSRIYLYEVEFFNGEIYYSPTGTVTQSGSNGDFYHARKAFDNDISTLWWTTSTTNQWIQIELEQAITLEKFRWNTSSSAYRPRNFVLKGSNDGLSWDLLYSGESSNTKNWKEFVFEATVKSEMENAFIITSKEYQWVDGPNNNGDLIDNSYLVKSIQNHPTEENSIQLLMENSFRNAVGNIIIEYNQALGTLAGSGGMVESFTETFIPTDLIEQGNPRVREYISGGINGSIEFIVIEKVTAYTLEYISASVSGTINLIHINDINP